MTSVPHLIKVYIKRDIVFVDYAEEWGAGAWSGEELSPVRDEVAGAGIDGEAGSVSERESLRNLSAAIAHRQRSEAEAEEAEREALLERVLRVDSRLSDLLRALHQASTSNSTTASGTADSSRLAAALR